MSLTIYIKDSSNPEAKAFIEYARSLSFVKISEEYTELSSEEKQAINEARDSISTYGTLSHEQVIDELKKKHPKAF
jgi:hypothetical protein